jgi:hypothetical protein
LAGPQDRAWWIDRSIGALAAVAMGSLGIYALVMFALALSGWSTARLRETVGLPPVREAPH